MLSISSMHSNCVFVIVIFSSLALNLIASSLNFDILDILGTGDIRSKDSANTSKAMIRTSWFKGVLDIPVGVPLEIWIADAFPPLLLCSRVVDELSLRPNSDLIKLYEVVEPVKQHL